MRLKKFGDTCTRIDTLKKKAKRSVEARGKQSDLMVRLSVFVVGEGKEVEGLASSWNSILRKSLQWISIVSNCGGF